MRAAKPKAIKPKVPLERDVQDEIVKVLALVKGIKVYQTSIRKGAGRDGRSGGGQDKGIPDLIISLAAFPGVYVGIEVKRPGTIKWSSPEQKEAGELNRFFTARSEVEALNGLAQAAANIGTPHAHRIIDQVEKLLQAMQVKKVA